MMLLSVQLPGHMFLLVRSLSLVPYSLRGSLSMGVFVWGFRSRGGFLSSGGEGGVSVRIF